MIDIKRLDSHFGTEISGVELAEIDADELRALASALYEHHFVVVRTGGLTRSELVQFARRLGEPIIFKQDAEYPEIIPITNVDVDTKTDGLGAAHWYTDQSFRRTVSSATMLYSIEAPESGGETNFCNMADAYDALPDDRRAEIEHLIVAHRHGVSIAARPGDHKPVPPQGWDPDHTVFHPLVRSHPMTGRKTLYAITGTSQGIVGMPREQAAELLNELCEHAFQDQFITKHKHAVHDLVIWDNPTTMHSATPIAAATGPHDTRKIDRISLRGNPPSLQGVAL